MHFSPVKTASGAADEQANTQKHLRSTMSPQGFPGPALPGVWKRAAPQSQATLQEQLVDLGRSTHSIRLGHQSPPSHISLREQYALPGQVETAGKVNGSILTLQKLELYKHLQTIGCLPIGKHPDSMTEKAMLLQAVQGPASKTTKQLLQADWQRTL